MAIGFNFEEECKNIIKEFPAVKQFEYLRMKGENIILLKYNDSEYESNILMNSMASGEDKDAEYRLKRLAIDHGVSVKIKRL